MVRITDIMDPEPILRDNQWVTVKETGEQGQVWGANGKAAFVCIPDKDADTVRVYLVSELSTQ